ncbi:Cys-tRNA(Pro) deacylase [Jeotgalibacillus haloalkalitolerans]|uniref:Cys-tRNA(Pro)/Cys-tRNA(Cys) deacylase n=1 Tax=Jeotgalibacillus haloalkalitolerans TaxID=3104292 RepID=A0ABU5KIQ0_9BACL|nr:Cys-tRNA(Pro) deacylase [Jeotgalibacillus sp. HH7-29]MDZ5711127.1 Cys-tRNA(Pro) deacylase [Jeotgalibacillus sp. HH7-29]
MGKGKTNAMRMLDAASIPYGTTEYDTKDGLTDGVSVAEKVGRKTEEVFKTLVAHGISKQYYVFVIPVDRELNLKKAAAAAGEKKVEMIPMKSLQQITGYIKGGCSPIGMKKPFPTLIDGSAKELKTILVSAGQVGKQIEINPMDLSQVTAAAFAELT